MDRQLQIMFSTGLYVRPCGDHPFCRSPSCEYHRTKISYFVGLSYLYFRVWNCGNSFMAHIWRIISHMYMEHHLFCLYLRFPFQA
jgi:hypothetical protein